MRAFPRQARADALLHGYFAKETWFLENFLTRGRAQAYQRRFVRQEDFLAFVSFISQFAFIGGL